jgi:[ribosomal protein S18]-alanine N-acetyltransferase
MPAVVIRRATLADLEPLVALERLFPTDRLSRRNFRHLLTRANADVFVCADGDGLLGNAVVLYRAHARRARLYSLVVAPAARGRGIAGRLLRHAEGAVRAHRCSTLYLEVRPSNTAARRLYKKFGYRMMRRVSRFYDDGTDALCLEQQLRPPPTRRRPS